MASQKSIRVEKVGIREFRICGYTRPYTAQLMAAGAEWQGRELYWRYTGDVLPASIQNIIIGQFSLTPETPMTAILDEPTIVVGESASQTRVVSFGDVMEHWDKTRQKWTDAKYVYIGRANGHYHLPQSRWANNHVMQDESQRPQVIEAYRQDLLKMDRATLHAELKKLAGKTLVCWCKKADQEVACHGDVLVEFIHNPPPLEVAPKTAAPVEPAKPEKRESKEGAKFRKLAEGLKGEIEHKNRPYPFDSQPPTRKRVDEYLSRKQEARALTRLQSAFTALATACDDGSLRAELKRLKTKEHVRFTLQGYGAATLGDVYQGDAAAYERARDWLREQAPEVVQTAADRLEAKRLEVALKDYADYFPTSMTWLQDKLLEAADIQQGDVILEPSAGTGHLAQAIRSAYPDNELRVIEIVPDFRQLLEMQGFNVVTYDFLGYIDQVDVVVQNPPFSRMEDIDHVYHAFKLLKPGGRLVSIMSASPFFSTQKKAETFRQWFSAQGGQRENLREDAFRDSERSTGVATCMIVMRKPKEAIESPSDILTEMSIMKAPQPLVAVGTMPDFVEAMPERQPIVARFRERVAEGETPLNAAIGALDEAITNPTSAVCAECGKAALYTRERDGKRYCEDCLPLPGALPKSQAFGQSSFNPVSPLRQQYLDLKAQHPNALLAFRLSDFYEFFDDDAQVVNRVCNVTLAQRPVGKEGRVPMAGFPHMALEKYVKLLLNAGHSVAIAEQVGKTDNRGVVERKIERVLHPNPVKNPDAFTSKAVTTEDGVPYLTTVPKKPDVTTVEGAAQILYGPKAEDVQPLTYEDYKRIKALYPDESQIVMLHVGAMWTTWDDDAETLEMAMKASQKGVRHPVLVLKSRDTAGRTITLYTAEFYVERFEEAVKAANLSLIKVNKDGSVRICNTVETASQSAQNINSTSTFVNDSQGAENAKNDAVAQKLTALVDALRKPAPESEIPFIALYISGGDNVELLFRHYIEAIRQDDPDMKLSRAKELAAAGLLYQYQQEWASTDVETKYPAIFEAFKAAAKGEILISMLLRISGLTNIVELTYDDDLMERLVDVVSYVPF